MYIKIVYVTHYCVIIVMQKSCKIIYRNALIKCQIFVLNLNMPKTEWEGPEDPINNYFFKIESFMVKSNSLLIVNFYSS